jgi:glycosyltransferase involved in cell wall biosynthesis
VRVGVEAKWLHRGPPSGRRVVRSLVRGLTSAAPEVEVHLFAPVFAGETPSELGVPAHRCHRVWAGNNGVSNVCVVPRAADALGLDAVVYQNFVPPAAMARHARVAFVHDAIFAARPDWFTWRERAYFAPLRWLTPTADRVCTVSHSERLRLVRHGFARAERVDVVPNGVDGGFAPVGALCAERVARVRSALALPPRFVLYAGRLTRRKNVAALVRAMARVPGLALVVAGAADRTSEDLAAVAAAAGVSDRVRLLGPVDDDALGVLYACATVFCTPSLDEGFGLTPLEAMAAGAPVVASNAPALVETCGGGAVHVDATDVDGLAGAIARVASDDALRGALRDAGLRRARAMTWERSALALLASVRLAVEARR